MKNTILFYSASKGQHFPITSNGVIEMNTNEFMNELGINLTENKFEWISNKLPVFFTKLLWKCESYNILSNKFHPEVM